MHAAVSRAPEWVFAYGSLLWRPAFAAEQALPATVTGWQRRLSVLAVADRGSESAPGLWFALEPGGRVRGLALRLPAAARDEAFSALWRREMPDDAYRPVEVECTLAGGGTVRALAFAANPASRLHRPALSPQRTAQLVLQGSGTRGTCAEYVRRTLQALDAHGLRDEALLDALPPQFSAPASAPR